MDANGGREQPGKGNFSRKTGNGHENSRGNGLHPVFLLFPVFLLGLWNRIAVGTRRVGPTRPTDGKEKTNIECRMLNVECRSEGGCGGSAKVDFCRKWTRMDANGGRDQPRREISAGRQEMGTKTGGERAFIVFSCVSCFLAWLEGLGPSGCSAFTERPVKRLFSRF